MSLVTVEGYRSHNKELFTTIGAAAMFFTEYLLGKRMDKYISVEIKLTKSLKHKEGAYGFCHIVDDNLNKPREFMIEVDASMKNSLVQMVTWLAHEMVHLKQFVRKELWDYETGQVQWKKRKYSTLEYDDQPWERQAYAWEDELYEEFAEWYYDNV